MPAEISPETRQEIKSRLLDGEKGTQISDDMEGVSESTVYRIKQELEEEQEARSEREDNAFETTPEPTRGDFEDVFRELNVGVKANGDMKSKVDMALSAIEIEGGLQDPYTARELLYEEGEMNWKWANRVVAKVFDKPGFPRDEDDEPRRGGPRPPHGREHRDRPPEPEYRDGYRDRPPDRGRRDDRRTRDDSPRWVDDLYRQMQQQAEALKEVAESLGGSSEERGRSAGSGIVEIHRQTEDGEMEVVRVPEDSPRAREAVGGDDDDGFLDTLVKAKDAGLIPSPDDFQDEGDEVADALQAGLERMADAQAQASENLQAAIGEIRQLAEADTDEDLTAQDVQDILDERLNKAERDRLRDEIRDLKEEVQSGGGGNVIMPQGSGTPLTDDPEVLTRYVDKQAEADQLNTVKHAGDTLVEKGIPEIRNALRELTWQMQYGQVPGGENAPSPGGPTPPGYTPPEERDTPEPEIESVEPEPEEPEVEESDEVGDLWEALQEAEA